MTSTYNNPRNHYLRKRPMGSQVISTTEFKTLKLKGRGKVRDIYDLGDRLLIVATDRISAFDVVMPNPVPDKGRILTQLSKFWFDLTKEIVSNHVISTKVGDYPQECRPYQEMLKGRSMLVVKPMSFPSSVWFEGISQVEDGRNIEDR